MSLALLQTALLLPLELAINRILTLDAASSRRLARLEGRTLALHTTQPGAQLYITIRRQGLHLSSLHEGDVTASLHGPLAAMLGLLLRREKISNLRPQQLELRGNTTFVQELQALLLDLNLDWEYHISRIIGDIPTGFLSSGLRQTRDYLQTTGSRLQEDAVEYLHEESRLFPASGELETFYHGINELMLQVDRLRARLELLHTKV